MFRSLTHYWRIHLAVVLGAAVATSVLTGALLVGDSVEGSLRRLTLGRLGGVDYAIVAARTFRETLADDLATPSLRVAPLIALNASIEVVATGVRANKIALFGVDDRFATFFDRSTVPDSRAGRLRILYANGPLRQTLGVDDEAALILTIERHSDIHREFLFGGEDADERVIRRRVRLGATVDDEAGGRFGFEPNQAIPLSAFVRLSALQNWMGLEGKVNRLVVSDEGDVNADVMKALTEAVRLEDYGLTVRASRQTVVLECDQFLLTQSVAQTARRVADDLELGATAVFTYLANSLSSEKGSVPYSIVSAIGSWSDRPLETNLISTEGSPVPRPEGNKILVNESAAKRLKVDRGDSLAIRYYEVEADESFTETDAKFRVGGVIRVAGLAGDRSLTPAFPGLHNAGNMADWDAPFPVDFGLIEEADEAYWDRYGATPKAFISLDRGRSLWSSRFGSLSSVRFQVPTDQRVDLVVERISSKLLSRLSPEGQGIRVVALREQGLASARGATDFRGLFFGFSLFLVVSGLAMMSQLFRLGILDRRAEIGLLKAVGFSTGRVRKRLLAEGMVLAIVGASMGVVLAELYGRLMIHGLSNWWFDAVGTRLLAYHGQPSSIAAGWLGAIGLIAIVIWRATGQFSAQPAVRLLKRSEAEGGVGQVRRARVLFIVFGIVSLLLLLATQMVTAQQQVGLFFGVGSCALISLLGCVRYLGTTFRTDRAGLWGLAFAQIARFPGRSMASITLVALAVFVLVAVGANRHGDDSGVGTPSGAGGFEWIAESAIPLVRDLNERNTLLDAGLAGKALDQLAALDIHSFRLRPGEDISCLNLHRPGEPRVLGVSERTVDRGGFSFGSVMDEVDAANPWTGLHLDLGDHVIPAIGDFNSVQWILHLGLGQDLVLRDEFGNPIRLRFVALLAGSVLQSEVLISEAQFVKHFPSREGYSFFAVDSDGEIGDAGQLLEAGLAAFGMDATTSRFRLARYRAVENTYMATFQVLGGLGALLGTLGIAVLMMRNAAERRGELAALRAIGFSRRKLSRLLFAETAVLILLGLGVGSAAGLLAVAPRILDQASHVPWGDVVTTLAAVGISGLVSGLVTSALSLRAPIVETLKSEG